MFKHLKMSYVGLQLIVVILPGKTPVYGKKLFFMFIFFLIWIKQYCDCNLGRVGCLVQLR